MKEIESRIGQSLCQNRKANPAEVVYEITTHKDGGLNTFHEGSVALARIVEI
jgi:hypothetical protein